MKEKKGDGTIYDSAGKHYMHPKVLKPGILLFLFILLLCCSVGCGKTDSKNQFNGFTVISINDVPEELKSEIKQRYKSPFELTYPTGKSDLYLVKGYGRQDSPGYNISVEDIYYSDAGLVVDTNLSEPEGNDYLSATPTYPYIIIKIEYTEDSVIFR